MAAVFYYDEWLKGKDSRINQVRLVKDNGGVDSDSIVIRGFTMSESFNIDVSHGFSRLNGINWINKLKGYIDQGREAALYTTTAMGSMTNFLRGFISGESAEDSESDNTSKADREKWATNFENFIGDLNHTVNTKIDYADAYMYAFDGTDITVPGQFKQLLLTDNIEADIEEDFSKVLDALVGDFTEKDGFVGFTEPPGGYETTIEGLKGNSPKGTFTMYIGDYRFPGVVVSGLSIDVSKTRVKTKSGNLKPLFIEIDYTVKPVIKYTKKHLKQWFSVNRSDLPQ